MLFIINGLKKRHILGLTYVELLISVSILAILALGAVPLAQVSIQRKKEIDLRRVLREMRDAIDQFKLYIDEGKISQEYIDQEGYPPDLETMVEGVREKGSLEKTYRFLRRIPVDPMTGEAEWGLRSYQDEPDSTSWGGQNVYDVYSLSKKKAIDGTYYKDW